MRKRVMRRRNSYGDTAHATRVIMHSRGILYRCFRCRKVVYGLHDDALRLQLGIAVWSTLLTLIKKLYGNGEM